MVVAGTVDVSFVLGLDVETPLRSLEPRRHEEVDEEDKELES